MASSLSVSREAGILMGDFSSPWWDGGMVGWWDGDVSYSYCYKFCIFLTGKIKYYYIYSYLLDN